MWRVIFVFLAALGGLWFGKGGELKNKPALLKNIHPEKNVPLSEHKSFVVVIYAQNQAAWCERALRSVFEQDYEHYRLILVDDGSSDGTSEKARHFIVENNQEEKALLIRNETKMGRIASLYRALDTCLDREIILPLDGKDWLASPLVLKQLNSVYQNPDVWVAFGKGIEYPTYEKMEAAEPSFYSALFKQIQLQDLFVNGEFIESLDGYLQPLLSLSGGRIRRMEEPLLFLNASRPSVPVAPLESIAQYAPLSSFPATRAPTAADILIFSFDRPLQLYACLESIQRYITGYENLTVLYRASDESFEAGYDAVKESFPAVTFVAQGKEKPKRDFKPNVKNIVLSTPSEYILFGVDDIIVKDFVDLKQCMELVEKTGAYGFYLRFGKHINFCYQSGQPQPLPPSQMIAGGVYAWDVETGEGDWGFPNSVDMTLFRKETLRAPLEELNYKTPNSLEFNWAREFAPEKALGLYFERSKLVNIPMNIVGKTGNPHMDYLSTEELLAKFNEGLKINIEPLYQIENDSPHMDYIPEFVIR